MLNVVHKNFNPTCEKFHFFFFKGTKNVVFCLNIHEFVMSCYALVQRKSLVNLVYPSIHTEWLRASVADNMKLLVELSIVI